MFVCVCVCACVRECVNLNPCFSDSLLQSQIYAHMHLTYTCAHICDHKRASVGLCACACVVCVRPRGAMGVYRVRRCSGVGYQEHLSAIG